MTARPGRIRNACVAYVTDQADTPPPRGTWTYSTNWKFLAKLTGVFRGYRSDADDLTHALRVQMGELTDVSIWEHRGMFADEDGGGYLPLQWDVVHCVIRHARNGNNVPTELLDTCRRWWGKALRWQVIRSARYADSILAAGPASRLRDPVANNSIPLQASLGFPARKFGLDDNSPRDAMQYNWRDADRESADFRRLIKVSPEHLAGECGVDVSRLRLAMSGDRRALLACAGGLVSLHPLRIRRYESGAFAAWWERFTSHDGPVAGAVVERDRLEALQPHPIGPRAINAARAKSGRWDHQWWCGDNVQGAEIEGDFLVGSIAGRPGRSNAGDDGLPFERQHPQIRLPRGRVVLDLLIDQAGAREVSGSPSPSRPVEPTPAPGPPMPPPVQDCRELLRERGRVIRDALLVRMGRKAGQPLRSDDFLRLIEEQCEL